MSVTSRLDLDLDLDLDVFVGPFDLLLTIVLREEVSLLEVELGEVVASYVSRLEEQGEIELPMHVVNATSKLRVLKAKSVLGTVQFQSKPKPKLSGALGLPQWGSCHNKSCHRLGMGCPEP